MHLVRVMFAAMAVVAAPTVLAAPCAGFDDVSDTDPFCAYVDWMKNRGITLGLTPTRYDPSSPVTRLQMAAFMYRLGFQNAFLQGGNAFGTTAVLGTTDDALMEIRANNRRVMRYDGEFFSPNLIGGYAGNGVLDGVQGATIGGGGSSGNQALENPPNRVGGNFGTVGGGAGNTAGDATANGVNATVGGGQGNSARGRVSTIAGGYSNFASGPFSFIGGGRGNQATSEDGMVLGGWSNDAIGLAASVLGGQSNTASGAFSVAVGQFANANAAKCFVFNGWSNGGSASCFGWPNSFHIYGENGLSIDFESNAGGGSGTKWVHIGNQIAGRVISANSGAHLTAGGVWTNSSSRSSKEAFEPVDPVAVLDRVAALPITTWRYKDDADTHLGPIAEDFKAAFGLGGDERFIGTIDADGVALAAIQGLNARLEALRAAKDAAIAALRAELDELKSVRNEIAALRAVLTGER